MTEREGMEQGSADLCSSRTWRTTEGGPHGGRTLGAGFGWCTYLGTKRHQGTV